ALSAFKCMRKEERNSEKGVAGQRIRPARVDRRYYTSEESDTVAGWPREMVYRLSSRNAASCGLDNAPTLVATALPSLNNISVGIPRTPNLAGVSGLSSTLSLPMVTRPAYSPAASSRMGAIILQGPHHAAQ